MTGLNPSVDEKLSSSFERCLRKIILLPLKFTYTEQAVNGYFLLDRSFHWDSKHAHSERYKQAHRLLLLAMFDVLAAPILDS
jgi:hypothetical protein